MTASAPVSRHERPVLITGGAGFIGSHLTEHLLHRGHHVVIVDDLSTGRASNLAHLPADRFTVHRETVSSAMPRFEPGAFSAIYHLAAAVGVRLVIDQPIGTIENNVLETSAVLNFADADATPVLIASTSEVYGKSANTPFSENDDVVYGSTRFSRWSYACSKAIDEYLALAHHRQRDLPVRILRFFNTVGPRQVGHYGMVLPRFVQAALDGGPIEVYGDGRQTRCFCDVRDVVQALPVVMSEPACAGQVYNIGSDRAISIADLAELVRTTLNSDAPIRFVPYDEAYGQGFDDLRHRQPDLTAISAAIGFQPTIPLEQTIRDIAAECSRKAGAAHRGDAPTVAEPGR